MKGAVLLLIHTVCLLITGSLLAQQPDTINFDESKAGFLALPALLKTGDGKAITSARQWSQFMRPAILSQFQQHVYGKMPGRPPGMHFRVNAVQDTAFNGKAITKQVTVFFTPGTNGPRMDVLLYMPKTNKARIPVFTGLNFYGNQSVAYDPAIDITNSWVSNNESGGIRNNKATEHTRGLQASRWPIESLIENGYGVATAYYGDLEPDFEAGWKTGVRTTLAETLNIKPEEWSAMGAWAWGLSRMLDYLETEPAADPRKVIVTGHSRLGKAALWAGANDTRFAAVVSNNSGEGGAALARRNFGETITRINTAFPHWFVPAFKNYNGRPEALPVDQHMLLALIAPRPLYVASAQDDQWADPKGEFLGAVHAMPVYRLFQKQGLSNMQMPAVNQPVGSTVSYHIRTGKHDITAYDWEQYIKWADKVMK